MASTITGLSAGNSTLTDQFLLDLMAGNVKSANTFKVVLLNLSLGSATINPAASTLNWSDLSAAELADISGKYTKGVTTTTGCGLTLATPGSSFATVAARVITPDFADLLVTAVTLTTNAYAIVRDSGTLTTSPVLALGRWSADQTPSGVDLSIPVAGILSVTRAATA